MLARGGRREAYPPVRSQLVDGGAASDPLVLARAYRDLLDCDEWYVADLDALAGGAVQRALVRALSGLRGRLLVDAAVSSPERACELVRAAWREAEELQVSTPLALEALLIRLRGELAGLSLAHAPSSR